MELASPFVPHGFTASPSWGLAATFIRSSLRWLTAARLQRFSPAGLRGGLTSFLPQALLPAGLTHCYRF